MKLGYLSVALAVICCLLLASTTYYKVKYDNSVRNYQSFRLSAEQHRRAVEEEGKQCDNFYRDNVRTLSMVAKWIAEGDFDNIEDYSILSNSLLEKQYRSW